MMFAEGISLREEFLYEKEESSKTLVHNDCRTYKYL